MADRRKVNWILNSRAGLIASLLASTATLAWAENMTRPQDASGGAMHRVPTQLAQDAGSQGANRITFSEGGATSARADRPLEAFDDLDTAASSLNDALAGARAKLDALREATELAAIAAQLRDELEAGAAENNRLAQDLAKAQAEQRAFISEQEAAQQKIADLTQELGEASADVQRLNEQLTESRTKVEAEAAARTEVEEKAARAQRQLAALGERNKSLTADNGELKEQVRTVRLERDQARTDAETARQSRDVAFHDLDRVRLRIAGLLRSVLHDTGRDAGRESAGLAAGDEPVVDQVKKIEGSYEILRPSNIRAEPSPDAERVDFVVTGQTVTVISQSVDSAWLEVTTPNGVRGFIFGELVARPSNPSASPRS